MLNELGAAFFIETSAKSGTNIEEVLHDNNEAIFKSCRYNVQKIHGERSISGAGKPDRSRKTQIEIIRLN